jgi:DMSO/TMAO reductase YedYZ molybdopterin-dependent catalytic subunit
MLKGVDRPTNRRRWMRLSMLAGGALVAGIGGAEWFHTRRGAADSNSLQGGKFAGTLEFEDEGRAPLDTLLGDELDGRLYADLSHLTPDRLVMSTEEFYVRTRASHLLDTKRPWSIHVTTAAGERRVTMAELEAQSQPQGLHLMECAGNTRAVRFGMISVAGWAGVPLVRFLDAMRFDPRVRILVSGFDEYAAKPVTPSVPGASWVFSRQDLEESGAFLAIRMNGQPLTRDHGAPVRLVLPGWYGCAGIKWVNEIVPVEEQAEATSQMREYAARTHQHGLPDRAIDYQPAIIDPAAMPIRIEKWMVQGTIRYNVIGIVWGGKTLATDLLIRFGPEEPYVPVTRVNAVPQNPWALWSHIWIPKYPGIYRIRLRLNDSEVRTRRLDTGFYTRQVRIDRV